MGTSGRNPRRIPLRHRRIWAYIAVDGTSAEFCKADVFSLPWDPLRAQSVLHGRPRLYALSQGPPRAHLHVG